MCLVTTLIDFFSPTAHASPWGTVAKRISGTQAGFKAHNLRMWRHSFLPKPKEKTIGRFSTPQQQLDPDINYRTGFTTKHLLQFTTLWALIAQTPLTPHHEDKIS
jgi:hypothetical protein